MAASDVVVTELLNDTHGSRGLHQRLLALGMTSGIAAGVGEAWYVAAGTGNLSAPVAYSLNAGCAVWLPGGAAYSVSGDELRIVAVTVLAGPGANAEPHVARFEDCTPEWTGDRQFRVLLSARLTITQFVGVIPPGRAPTHQHTYDEVVHVLSGSGVVHLPPGDRPIAPGSSIYLPPGTPHCLENTGTGDLRVLGIFHPAGNPAAKTV